MIKNLILIYSFIFSFCCLAFAENINVKCSKVDCVFAGSESAIIYLKNVPVPSESNVNVFVDAKLGVTPIQFKKNGLDYVFKSESFNNQFFRSNLSLNVYLKNEKKEKAISDKIALLDQQILRIDELLSHGSDIALIEEKSKIVSLRANLLVEKEKTKVLVYTTSLPVQSNPIWLPSEGTLRLSGIDANVYNDVLASLKIEIEGSKFSTRISDYTIFLNDVLIPSGSLTVTSNSIIINQPRREGLNTLRFYGYDSKRRTISGFYSFIAGSKSVVITVKDNAGNALVGAAVKVNSVNSKLSFSGLTDSNGSIVVNHLPASVGVNAVATYAGGGAVAFLPSDLVSKDLVLAPMSNPVIANLDYFYSLDGWDLSSGQVERFSKADDLSEYLVKPKSFLSLAERYKRVSDKFKKVKNLQNYCYGDCTLILSTGGAGAKTTSHTFVAAERNLQLRYRFKTNEVFNGYEDTAYDDSYLISYRTSSGKAGSVSNSVRSLSKAAFDKNGISNWMTFNIDNAPGDTVELFLQVNNVGDDLYDSLLQLDQIRGTGVSIDASLGSNTFGLSLGNYPYQSGYSHIPVHLKLTGTPFGYLSTVKSTVTVAGVSFDGAIYSSSTSLESTQFPASGAIESDVVFKVKSPTDLQIPANAKGDFSVVADYYYGVNSLTLTSLPILISKVGSVYNGTGTSETGSDWIQTKYQTDVDLAASILGSSYTYLSQMNGGIGSFIGAEFGTAAEFSPSWYEMWQEESEVAAILNLTRREAVANKIVALVNDPVAGKNIQCIWLDGRFYKDAGEQVDPFWTKLLSDPKTATIAKPRQEAIQKFQILY